MAEIRSKISIMKFPKMARWVVNSSIDSKACCKTFFNFIVIIWAYSSFFISDKVTDLFHVTWLKTCFNSDVSAIILTNNLRFIVPYALIIMYIILQYQIIHR